MSEEKPLHVQVAEALGCSPVPRSVVWACPCADSAHGQAYTDGYQSDILEEYDTDWAATGPLIERFKVTLFEPSVMGYDERVTGLREAIDSHPTRAEVFWTAVVGYENGIAWDPADEWKVGACGPTPLIAICNLIVAIH